MVFSVIMPVYNKAAYLEKAVASVLSQAYLKELIAVDDGSTDGSGELLDKLAGEDSRIRVIHQRNMGVSAARNVGISAASGEYLCFADGDDTLEDTFFKEAWEQICQSMPDIAFFDYRKVFESGEVLTVSANKEGTYDAAHALELLYPLQKRNGYFGCATNKLVKSSLAKSCAFDVNIKLAEDLDYWVQAMDKAELCFFSASVCANYFQARANSSCFSEVDYAAQLKLRIRYRALLKKRIPHTDLSELNGTISDYVYFTVADACEHGVRSGIKAVKGAFETGLKRKELAPSAVPPFHGICLFFIKHRLDTAGVLLLRLKQKLRRKGHA